MFTPGGTLLSMTDLIDAWVVLVTDGTLLEVAPEVFLDRDLAQLSAENWAWFLSFAGEFDVEQPFEGRFQVGHRDVRLAKAVFPSMESDELWVGTHWTEDGYPDPEATILPGPEAARAWAIARLAATAPDEVHASRWHVAATFRRGGEEAYSVAYAAKFVARAPLAT